MSMIVNRVNCRFYGTDCVEISKYSVTGCVQGYPTSCKRLIDGNSQGNKNRKFLQTSVPFVPILKVSVSATVVLLGLKQFHASVGCGYLCCWFEMLKMTEWGVEEQCSMSNGNSVTQWSG